VSSAENVSAPGPRPLAGVRVIEMAGKGALPQCAMMLADMGADVTRIDRPLPVAPVDLPRDRRRGRRSLVLDVKSSAGRDVLFRMVQGADVLIEGYRPGVMERLGLGPDICLERNQRLVYGRVSGWGQTGTLQHSAGHDINYISLTGALHAVGPKAGPPLPPMNFAGDGAGGMLAAFGVVCALYSARQSQRGQVVDAAMLDASACLMTNFYLNHSAGEWLDQRESNKVDGGFPSYGSYETADNEFIAIGPIEDRFFDEFLRLVGLAPETYGERWDRSAWPAQRQAFADLFKGRTREEWCSLLEGRDACFSPVLGLSEAPHHSHNTSRGTFTSIDGVMQPTPAPRFSNSEPDTTRGWAHDGQHSRDVLNDLGLSAAEIDSLIEEGTVRQH
jgi:alpha-methylacyl-CoA racemase